MLFSFWFALLSFLLAPAALHAQPATLLQGCLELGQKLIAQDTKGDKDPPELHLDIAPEPLIEAVKQLKDVPPSALAAAMVVSGTGALKGKNSEATEFRYHCLLDAGRKALLFHMVPATASPALHRCYRFAQDREGVSECLGRLAKQTERQLKAAEKEAADEAEALDKAMKKTHATPLLQSSIELWKQYREAECSRARESMAGGSGTEDMYTACTIDLALRRIKDLTP